MVEKSRRLPNLECAIHPILYVGAVANDDGVVGQPRRQRAAQRQRMQTRMPGGIGLVSRIDHGVEELEPILQRRAHPQCALIAGVLGHRL